MSEITSFKGPYAFLSNFWFCDVVLDGLKYKSVEHAFQAAKTFDPEWRAKIRLASKPGEAKKLGRQVPLRSDWEEVKLDVMHDLLYQKFTSTTILRLDLLRTVGSQLIEGNYWHDTFWGVCDGIGQNWLGRLLMEVRDELLSVRLRI